MEPLTERKRLQAVQDTDKRKKIEKALSFLVFDEDKLKRMIDTFESQIKLANSTDEKLRKQTDLYWENTYVRHLLDGTENGTYLGIDLGGTNFRIVKVVMTNGEANTETKYYNLNKQLLSGPSAGIFDHIASCLKEFLEDIDTVSEESLALGFTFSFPSIQKSLKCSVLQTWTKCFTCPDGKGIDPVVMLEEAIARQGGLKIPVEIVGRLSDTTGTLLAGNLVDKKCRIGLIIGTGSNAAYVEYTRNIEKWDSCYKDNDDSDRVVINCEFGNFGDNGCLVFLKDDLDHEVDKWSPHPHSFTFEKLFSGLYLGEICRLVLERLTKRGLLFSGKGSDELFERWNLKTSDVTAIEKDKGNSTCNTTNVLKKFGLAEVSDEDLELTKEVCELVSKRGAYIIATAMVVLLDHIDLPEVTIAIDGSLYEHHPKYHSNMMYILDTYRPKTKATLTLVKDGSGQGAALVAAIERCRRPTIM